MHSLLLGLSFVLAGAATGDSRLDDKAVPPELLQGLKADKPEDRVKAIKELSKLGVEAVAPLVGALRDEEADVSQAAAYGLRLLKGSPADLVAALGPHLKDENPQVRKGVAGALGRCGGEALPALTNAFKDEDADVRKQVTLSLDTVARKDKGAWSAILAILNSGLKDPDPKVRLTVVQTLARCGPGAVPLLLAALEDEDVKVRANAPAALGALKPEARAVLPALARRFKAEKEVPVKQSLLQTLGKLGPEAVAPLTDALRDDDPGVQLAALKALGPLGPEARPALAAMKELAVQASNPSVRSLAVKAVARVGPEGQAAVLDLLRVADTETRLACLQILGSQSDKVPKQAVPALVAALTDKEKKVRALAAFVLGKIGPDARDALPALAEANKDRDTDLAPIIDKAVKQIEGK